MVEDVVRRRFSSTGLTPSDPLTRLRAQWLVAHWNRPLPVVWGHGVPPEQGPSTQSSGVVRVRSVATRRPERQALRENPGAQCVAIRCARGGGA